MKYIIILSLILGPSAHSINLVYKTPGYVSNLRNDTKAAAKVLAQYEWPSAINWVSDQAGKVVNKGNLEAFNKAFLPEDSAETSFINEKLQEIDPNLKAIFIPQTLWEVFSLVDLYENGDQATRQARTQFIFNTIKSLRKTLNAKTLDFMNEQGNARLLLTLLERFNKKSKVEYNRVSTELRESLIKEIEGVKDLSSPLLAAINEEAKAHLKNRVLIYRATNGVQLFPKKNATALDFPVPPPQSGPGRLEGTVVAALKNLETMVNNNDLRSVDLSFQYSIFGGCLSDEGICPFYYWSQANAKVLYALSLTRSFAQLRAKQLLFLPAFNADEVLYKEGIMGHPRFKLIGPFRFPFDEMLGGNAYKFGYYQPMKHWLVNKFSDANLKNYFSYLLEVATLLARNSLVLGIKAEAKNLTPALLKRGQKNALNLLTKAIMSHHK